MCSLLVGPPAFYPKYTMEFVLNFDFPKFDAITLKRQKIKINEDGMKQTRMEWPVWHAICTMSEEMCENLRVFLSALKCDLLQMSKPM